MSRSILSYRRKIVSARKHGQRHAIWQPALDKRTWMGVTVTTGEWIVLGIFGIGLACSISLFWWLVRTVRRDSRRKDDAL